MDDLHGLLEQARCLNETYARAKAMNATGSGDHRPFTGRQEPEALAIAASFAKTFRPEDVMRRGDVSEEDGDAICSAVEAAVEVMRAALVAARILINRGDTRRASALLRRTWRASFHPDAATLYAHVKPGISAVDRLKRIRTLVESPQSHPMAAIVLARAAIDAYEWSVARNALAPFLAKPTRQMCLLMAEIEEGQSGDQGKAREWLSRAVSAPADPTWTADGVTSDEWAPASPVTGRLDAFEWKVPVQSQAPAKTLSSPVSETGAALPAIEDAATPTKTQP